MSDAETPVAASARAELAVGGMTCTACSGAVERCLKARAGVVHVDVILLQERAMVDFDPSKVTAAQLCEEVEDMGFDAALIQQIAAGSPPVAAFSRAELAVGGMTCTACSGAVERCLKARDGVVHVDVILLQEKAMVEFDPSKVTAAQLCEEVEDMGFDAALIQEVAAGSPSDQVSQSDIPPGVLHLEGGASPDEIRAAAGGQGFMDVQQMPPAGSRPGLLRVIYNPDQVGARKLLARLKVAGCEVQLPKDPPPLGGIADSLHAEQHELHLAAAFWSAIAPAAIAFIILFVVMSENHTFSHGLGGQIMLGSAAIDANWATFGSSAGRYFIENARKALQHRSFTMDVLVAASTVVTSIYGLGLALLYFGEEDSPVMMDLLCNAAHFLAMAPVLLLAVLGGKRLEHRARQRTGAALKELLAEQPSKALVRLDSKFEEIPLELLELGDLCRVTAGARFPAEGSVVEGAGAADESLVTGESSPVDKRAGAIPGSSAAACLAGSTLAHGDVVMRVSAVGPATTLGRLADLVAKAQGSKPELQRLADTLAQAFVPTVLGLTVCTIIMWLCLLFCGFIADAPEIFALKVGLALQYGLAVMTLACPCAMGLATPTAISVAVGVASKHHQCLVKNAGVLEAGSATKSRTAIVLDKTGTITEGRPSVVAHTVLAAPELEVDAGGVVAGNPTPGAQADDKAAALWALLGCCEAACPVHPVATAVQHFCASQVPSGWDGLEVAAGDLELVPGCGFKARVRVGPNRFTSLAAGALSMLPELRAEFPTVDWEKLQCAAQEHQGATLVFVAASGGAVAGVLALRDPVRAEVPAAVDALRRSYGRGSEVWVCTGDNESSALVAAAALRVPPEQTKSEQRPADKCALIQQLQKEGAYVIMVGDGLNDAPALAQADLGVAIGAGAHLACNAADVVLCRSSLVDLLAFRELSISTRNTIYRNFAWAFGFNIIGLPLAAGAGYPWGVSISPMVAGMAMACSSVLVVSSSLMLNRFQPSLAAPAPRSQDSPSAVGP